MVQAIVMYCLPLEIIVSVLFCTEWFVSNSGTKEEDCGRSLLRSCLSLRSVISSIKDYDIIYIDARGTDMKPISYCSDQIVSVSFSLIGLYGQPKLQCTNDNNSFSQRAILQLSLELDIGVNEFNKSSASSLSDIVNMAKIIIV